MRVTVPHNKPKDEAIRIVNEAVDQVLKTNLPAAVEIKDVKKQWNGDRLDFSLHARFGFMSSPIQGWAEVTNKDITIDCDLPSLFKAFLPEATVKAGLESKVKGLLT